MGRRRAHSSRVARGDAAAGSVADAQPDGATEPNPAAGPDADTGCDLLGGSDTDSRRDGCAGFDPDAGCKFRANAVIVRRDGILLGAVRRRFGSPVGQARSSSRSIALRMNRAASALLPPSF